MHIVILGGGFSGLCTAWFIKKKYPTMQVSLFEKNSKAGGWVQTIRKEGFLFDLGPQSYRGGASGYKTAALVEELGLERYVTVPSRFAKKRYLYAEKQLQRMPSHLLEIPFLKSMQGWMAACKQDWTTPCGIKQNESIYEFFSRRLGKTWTERLVDPWITGIYGGDFRLLCMQSCLPAIYQREQEKGSLIKSLWQTKKPLPSLTTFTKFMQKTPLFSFTEGMEVLPQALAQGLAENLYLNTEVKHISFQQTQCHLHLTTGQNIYADHVISTLPAFQVMPLFSDSMKNCLSQKLTYVDIVVVNLGFLHPVLSYKGFGYLVPSYEPSSILGCVWNSSIFPEQNQAADHTRLTVMMGGRRDPTICERSDEEIKQLVEESLRLQLKIYEQPAVIHITRARHSIPQYEIGYQVWKQAVTDQFAAFSSLFTLSGTAFSGISLANCIEQAEKVVDQLPV